MSAVHTYKFDVAMSCSGCSGAVTRVLEKAKTEGGVTEYDVSLKEQKVTVTGTLSHEDVLERIKKTGKKVEYTGETVD